MLSLTPEVFNKYYEKLDSRRNETKRFKGNYGFSYFDQQPKRKDSKYFFLIWVNPEDDSPVGYIIAQKIRGVDNALDMIEVFSKYKGRGLSRQILEYLIKRLKIKILEVEKNNEIALILYLKCGFEIHPVSKELVESGKADQYVMSLPGTRIPKSWIYS